MEKYSVTYLIYLERENDALRSANAHLQEENANLTRRVDRIEHQLATLAVS